MEKLTNDLLKKYFDGQLKHPCYAKSVALAKRLSIHADGSKDGYGDLIAERRPGEDDDILTYRKKIIIAKTKQTISSVITELGKIRKVDGWSITYDQTKFPSIVEKGETLQDYCEMNFPKFKSFTDWVFSVLLKKYFVDSHAAIMIIPITEVDTVTYKRPYPLLFSAEQVYGYEEDNYAVLYSKKKCTYVENGTSYQGDIFYVADTQKVERYEQTNAKRDFDVKETFRHDFGYLPVRLMKGVVQDTIDDENVYESRFLPMAESLDECIREYSDLQAGVVRHLHPEKWIYSNQQCKAPGCQNGKVFQQGTSKGQWNDCDTCKGTGQVSTGPYKTYVLKPPTVGDVDRMPTPPGGYFDKPGVTDMIKLQDERVDKHQYQALASVNMQFLWKVPLAESGIAKAEDRDSLNTLVNLVTEDIVNIMDWGYKVNNDWRYKYIVPDEETRKGLLPKVNAPSNYDILSSGYLIEEIKKARDGRVSPMIVNHLEIQYCNKMFNADSSIKDELAGIISLDPLSGYSPDDKNSMLQNNGISEIDFIISCNIREFMKMAMEDKKFADKPYDQKMKILRELAEKKREETRAANEITNPLDEGDPLNLKPGKEAAEA